MSVGQRTVRAGVRGARGGRVSVRRGGERAGREGGGWRSLGRCTAAASAGATDDRYALRTRSRASP